MILIWLSVGQTKQTAVTALQIRLHKSSNLRGIQSWPVPHRIHSARQNDCSRKGRAKRTLRKQKTTNKHQLTSPTSTLLASASNIRHPESKGHGLSSAIARDDHCVAHLRLGFSSSFWSPGNGPKIGILHDFT